MPIRGFVIAGLLALAAGAAHADEGRLLGDDSFAVSSHGQLVVDGGLFVGMPSALPAGMSTGVAAGVARECSCWWSYGARASWSQETQSNGWTSTQQDYRLRGTFAIRHRFGRGSLALRLGLGPTVVHEHRTRDQSQNLPPMPGISYDTRALAALPAGDLDAVVSLHVAGPWLMIASGGPSIDYFNNHVHGGWTAMLGVGWQP